MTGTDPLAHPQMTMGRLVQVSEFRYAERVDVNPPVGETVFIEQTSRHRNHLCTKMPDARKFLSGFTQFLASRPFYSLRFRRSSPNPVLDMPGREQETWKRFWTHDDSLPPLPTKRFFI